MTVSRAGADDGLKSPEKVDIVTIREQEESHGSPAGKKGIVMLWHGNGYDRDEAWISCGKASLRDLGTYE